MRTTYRRWGRALLVAAVMLMLTAGDRPTGCGGCTSDRLIAFRRSLDVDHTFHFFEHVSQGVTGIAQLLDAFNRGDPIAITELDSNSDGMIFEGDSTIDAGGLHPPTIFDSLDTPTTHWAHLPYTFADNGPKQVVNLTPTWTTQIRTVRNYDHGLCFARVTYDTLIQQVHARLAGRFGGYCLGDGSEFFRLGTEVRSALPVRYSDDHA